MFIIFTFCYIILMLCSKHIHIKYYMIFYIGTEEIMSQAKVDKYKQEKANRKKIMKKEKRERALRTFICVLVSLAILGFLGWSIYDKYNEKKNANQQITLSEEEMSSLMEQLTATTTTGADTSNKETSSEKASDEKTSDEESSSEKASDEETSGEKASDEESSSEKASENETTEAAE